MTAPKDGRSRRRPKEETKRKILTQAREMLAEEGTVERIDLRLSAVLTALDLTSGAGYNIWPNQESFQRDLALSVVRDFEWAGPNATAMELDPDKLTGTYQQDLRNLASQYFTAFVSRDEFFIALRFWGIKEPSDELRSAIEDGYRGNHDEWKAFYALGLELAQRRVKPGYTLDDLVVMAMAVTEGMGLRSRFDGDSIVSSEGRDLHSEAIVGIVEFVTEPIDSEATSAQEDGGDKPNE